LGSLELALTDLSEWLDERSRIPSAWFVKRLQANDTLAARSHQAGPYLPKPFLFAVFPDLRNEGEKNPRVEFNIYIDSQGDHRQVHAIWYNNRLFGGTRNETRITGLGGVGSDLLDPESTGAVAVLAFDLSSQTASTCYAWVCRDETESDLVEAIVGRVDPGRPVTWTPEGTSGPDRFVLPSRRKAVAPGGPMATQLPLELEGNVTPVVDALVRRSALLEPLASQPADTRLLRRHERFVDLFRQSEQDTYAPAARKGFADITSLLETAERINAARKARGDDGLALQLRQLLIEEGLSEGLSFSFRPDFDADRAPDFVFPAVANGRLTKGARLLLVEPTVRDRWKAAVEETGASGMHVLTLQRGASAAQFADMSAAGITLVVPSRLHDTYPSGIRAELMTLESFIAEVRHLTCAA
jgi:hypothetical protein